MLDKKILNFLLTLTHFSLFCLLFLSGYLFAYGYYYFTMVIILICLANAYLNDWLIFLRDKIIKKEGK
jgi:hypothetical protein